ncbi:MAG: hypothetical protein H5T61_00660 [Thermoflexales bacterium]|nr:hypothetical protein [Thermoflexales bacterium]
MLDEELFIASKDEFYFGFKGGLRIASNGMIVPACVLPANSHDSQLTEVLVAGMPNHAACLGDKTQEKFQQEYDLYLLTPCEAICDPRVLCFPRL